MAQPESPASAAGTPRHAQQPPTALPNDVVAERMNDSPEVQAARRVQALDEKTATPEATTSTPRSPSSEGAHAPVVPQYPYNTSLAPFLGLGPHNNPTVGGTPDDSEVTTNLPSVQVDYLSHDWSEEDVWASWRATTKHKANIVNGLRLENASWRTWNKQRNNLKTISPETLNWLKDSDVTWLYGPLHTAHVDPNPRPKDSGTADRLGLEDAAPRLRSSPKANKLPLHKSSNSSSNSSITPQTVKKPQAKRRGSVPPPKKPILKYRSLSDILTVPSLKHRQYSYELDESPEGSTAANTPTGIGTPRIVSPEDSGTEDADEDKPMPSGRRRHIAFANRVEQCIAVDSEEERERYTSRLAGANTTPGGWSSRMQNPRGSYFHRSSSSEESEGDEDAIDDGEDDESSDDDSQVLTVRSSRPAMYTSQSSPQPPTSEHFTIAKLAPTVLKSSEALPVPSPPVIYSPESRATQLPPEPSAPASHPHEQRFASGSQHPSSAPYTSSPLVGRPVQSHSESSADADSVERDQQVREEVRRYGIGDDDGDYDFDDSYLYGTSPSSPKSAALPTAKAGGQGASPPKSGTPNKGATPSKSILKKTAAAAADDASAETVTGSETDSVASGASDSTGSSPASSVTEVAGSTPAFVTSSHGPPGASEPVKAERETRGRPVVRTSSGSSLDGRSASRNASLGSGGGSSVSPVVSTDHASAGATSSAASARGGRARSQEEDAQVAGDPSSNGSGFRNSSKA